MLAVNWWASLNGGVKTFYSFVFCVPLFMELHFDHLECIVFGFMICVVTYLNVEEEPSYVTKMWSSNQFICSF